MEKMPYVIYYEIKLMFHVKKPTSVLFTYLFMMTCTINLLLIVTLSNNNNSINI